MYLTHHSAFIEGGGSNMAPALHLKRVPEQLNNETFLMNHFAQFGRVTNVRCNTAKLCSTVFFETQVSRSFYLWCLLDI